MKKSTLLIAGVLLVLVTAQQETQTPDECTSLFQFRSLNGSCQCKETFQMVNGSCMCAENTDFNPVTSRCDCAPGYFRKGPFDDCTCPSFSFETRNHCVCRPAFVKNPDTEQCECPRDRVFNGRTCRCLANREFLDGRCVCKEGFVEHPKTKRCVEGEDLLVSSDATRDDYDAA